MASVAGPKIPIPSNINRRSRRKRNRQIRRQEQNLELADASSNSLQPEIMVPAVATEQVAELTTVTGSVQDIAMNATNSTNSTNGLISAEQAEGTNASGISTDINETPEQIQDREPKNGASQTIYRPPMRRFSDLLGRVDPLAQPGPHNSHTALSTSSPQEAIRGPSLLPRSQISKYEPKRASWIYGPQTPNLPPTKVDDNSHRRGEYGYNTVFDNHERHLAIFGYYGPQGLSTVKVRDFGAIGCERTKIIKYEDISSEPMGLGSACLISEDGSDDDVPPSPFSDLGITYAPPHATGHGRTWTPPHRGGILRIPATIPEDGLSHAVGNNHTMGVSRRFPKNIPMGDTPRVIPGSDEEFAMLGYRRGDPNVMWADPHNLNPIVPEEFRTQRTILAEPGLSFSPNVQYAHDMKTTVPEELHRYLAGQQSRIEAREKRQKYIAENKERVLKYYEETQFTPAAASNDYDLKTYHMSRAYHCSGVANEGHRGVLRRVPRTPRLLNNGPAAGRDGQVSEAAETNGSVAE